MLEREADRQTDKPGPPKGHSDSAPPSTEGGGRGEVREERDRDNTYIYIYIYTNLCMYAAMLAQDAAAISKRLKLSE